MQLLCLRQSETGSDAIVSNLDWTNTINFKLQTYSRQHCKLRLSVYNDRDFKYNLRKYIDEFVPECERIAKALR